MPQLVVLVGPSCSGKTTFMRQYWAATQQREADWVTLSGAQLADGLHKRNKAVWRAMFPSAPFGFQATSIGVAAAPSLPPSRETLLSNAKHVVLDGVNASAAERRSLFQHMRSEVLKFPSKSNADEGLMSVIVVFFSDTVTSAKGSNTKQLGSIRHRLYGYRLADDCLSSMNFQGADHSDSNDGHSTTNTQPSALFAAPTSTSITIERPTVAEGIDCLIVVNLQEEVGDAAVVQAARVRCMARLPAPTAALGMAFYSLKHPRIQSLFYPATSLISFVQSKKVQGLRPIFSPQAIKALWRWATAGKDNRRVVILTGELPLRGAVGGAHSQPADTASITHKQLRQLFSSLALPFPIFSFSTRMSHYRQADDAEGQTKVSARSKSQQSTTAASTSEFLPLDSCAVAYLERLINLGTCVGLTTANPESIPKSVLGIRCLGLNTFLAGPLVEEDSSHDADGPQWVDWSAHPCFATHTDRRLRNKFEDAIEHPFGNMLTACLQCHGCDMPQVFSIAASMPQAAMDGPSQGRECPAATETLAHKSSGENLARISGSYSLPANIPSAPSLPSLPTDPVTAKQQQANPIFVCSLISAEVFFGQAAIETGRAYVQAGQIKMSSVRCTTGSPFPYRPLILDTTGDNPQCEWPPSEPSAMTTAVVTALVRSSDMSHEYECTVMTCSGRPVTSYCACGTAFAAYGGNHCRHCAALTVLFSECTLTTILKNVAAAIEAEEQDNPNAPTSQQEHLDAADVPNTREGGAASRSTYVPKGTAVLVGGIPQFMVPKQPKVRSNKSNSTIATKSQGNVKILGPNGIPHRKVPLGPSAPTRRPLTPYFFFMRTELANDEPATDVPQQAPLGASTISYGTANPEDENDDAEPKPKKKVTEITKRLAERWRGLGATEKARIETACGEYNEAVKAEWAAYAATDEYARYITAYAATGGLAPKRARAKEQEQSETDDSGEDQHMTPSGAVTADAIIATSRPWHQNSQGQLVCVWDTDDSGDDEPNKVPTNQPLHKPPVLGSLFPNAESTDLGQLTRGSTLAHFGNDSTVGGSSGIARRRTSRYLSVASTRDLQ